MSVYLENSRRGWKFSFTINGRRYQSGYHRTKKEAKTAEALKRLELETGQDSQEQQAPVQPQPQATGQPAPESKAPAQQTQQTPTVMGFLDLVNRRLDYVKAYNSNRHYTDYLYMAKRWIARWGDMACDQITQDIIQEFIFERMEQVSPDTANKELRYLRATFNFGKKKGHVQSNPTDGIEFLPVERRVRMPPPMEDIDKVIAAASPERQDYLWTIRDTLGRMSEINRLTWQDIDFAERTITLYTRKKKGGHLTPRKVPMTERLFDILSRRYAKRNPDMPWVFWHTYTSSKTREKMSGPYQERKKIMKTLCKNAKVPYFRYHALRHAGASIMDSCNVPIGSIQRILGHENRTTTEIYLHSIGQIEREAMTTYEAACNGSAQKG